MYPEGFTLQTCTRSHLKTRALEQFYEKKKKQQHLDILGNLHDKQKERKENVLVRWFSG